MGAFEIQWLGPGRAVIARDKIPADDVHDAMDRALRIVSESHKQSGRWRGRGRDVTRGFFVKSVGDATE